MKNLKDRILLILAAVLLVVLAFAVHQCNSRQQAENKAERWENNYYKPNQQTMSIKEFKAWQKKENSHFLDSINKLFDLNLRPKNITNYQTIVNKYLDTNLVEIKMDGLPNDGLYPLSYIDPKQCWGFDGYFHAPSMTLGIERRMFNDSIYSIEYFEQKKILWIIPIGRKKFSKITYSTCKGKISEEQITIEKKPDKE